MTLNKTSRKHFLAFILAFLICFSIISPSFALSPVYFQITWVESSYYPTVQVYMSVSDSTGLQISGLEQSLFKVEAAGQPVTDFQIQDISHAKFPLSIVLAIDTSGSMEAELHGVTALDNAVQAAKDFLGQLNPDDQVGILSFADEVVVVQEITTDKDAAKVALDTLTPGGETKLYDAVVQGVELLDGVQGRKLVVFLTDGKDSGTSDNTLEHVIQKASAAGIPVFPIGFGSTNTVRLTTIAEETGGFAQFQPDASSIQGGFSTVLNLLRRQLLITFASSLPADASDQDVKVTFNYQGTDYISESTFQTQPYSISIDSPAEGDQFSDPTGINVTLNPGERTNSVDFLLDGEVFATETSPPFSTELPIAPDNYGEHILGAVATDLNGITAETSINIITRPAVLLNFTSHQEGNLLRGSPTIVVEPDALYALVELRILINGELVAAYLEPPYAYEWPLYNVDSGEYLLAAEAMDVNGNSGREEILITASGIDPTESDYTIYYIIGAVVILAGVLIPLSLRRRKKVGAGAAPAGQFELYEIHGRSPDKSWSLTGEDIRLGRQASENDIPLDGLNASRRMAVIRPIDQEYIIYSQVAENPVIINGSPITQQHTLEPGDVIRLGDSEFRFQVSTTQD
jgi:VWFA-related protein